MSTTTHRSAAAAVRDRRRPGPAVLAALVDLALVLLFVAIGRSAHAEHDSAAGLARTAWPFAAALAAGWLVARLWRAPTSLRRATPAWAVAVALGHVLRLVAGQGSAVSFVVVSAVVLGVFLLGWRALAALTRRAGPRRGRA